MAHGLDGRTGEAINLLEKAIATATSILGPDDQTFLRSKSTLVSVYGLNSKSDKSIRLFESVAEIMVDSFTENDLRQLVSQHNLAVAYIFARQVGKGISLMQHVVSVQSNALPINHPDRTECKLALWKMQRDLATDLMKSKG